MTRIRQLILGIAVAATVNLPALGADMAQPASYEPPDYRPSLRHSQISRLVTDFIEKSHYRKSQVDDELSSLIFDNYIDGLDGNRSYFTQADLQSFER
ncbi:MAG: hypothetical protein AAFX58_12430, partial [Pseudomonadota bacterium]